MKASLEWIKEFVAVTATPDEIGHRLTMAGLEIEGAETVDGDTVFEVNVTPNRPDCLSILGIAREVAAAFGLPLRLPETAIASGAPASDVPVNIAAPDLCARYTGRTISATLVTGTPAWMAARLERCGIRALDNSIVDITNYVLLELGHPLHAFDADKLAGPRIRVDRAGTERTVRTLDGADRTVGPDTLLIWDDREPVAVAGVMGGEGSSVSFGTRNVFLESAYFEPSSIRRTSRLLGLKSESSYRFERGTDIEFLVSALDRAALLMQQTGGGTIHALVDAHPRPFTPPVVAVRPAKVNALLGTALTAGDMASLLGRIGLRTEVQDGILRVTPPPFRRDITAEVDVAEEVARLHGYDAIPVAVPRAPLAEGLTDVRSALITAAGGVMRGTGFSEVVNYSFMNAADLDLLGLSPDDPRRRHLRVLNPLRQEDAHLRTTLLPSLIANFMFNLSRGIREIRLYEIAKVFFDEGGELPREALRLAGIYFREEGPALWKDETPPFYAVKGFIEALCAELKLADIAFSPSQEPFLHPGKSAELMIGGRRAGCLGETAPGVIDRLNLKISKPQIILFEIDLDVLVGAGQGRTAYRPIPRFPAIDRDIAVIVDQAVTADDVVRVAKEYSSALLEAIELFDCYRGKHVPEGKKSLAFRIVYRSPERTLTDSEIEAVHAGLVDHILGKTNGALRSA